MHSEVHHGKGVGILVCDNAKGVIEDNTISCNGRAGIAILSGGDPLVRACRARQCPCTPACPCYEHTHVALR